MVRVVEMTSSGRRYVLEAAALPEGSVGPVRVAVGRWSSEKPVIPSPRPASEDLVALASASGVLV
jgi:hypothetical protein